PAGVRSNERFPSTTYAAGIGLAASWNPQLAMKVGEGIGKDARARGIHFMLGPGLNIYRSPLNGRNFEYFGEDPFLASSIAVGYITGMQTQGVSATVKHFFANNSEFDRHNTDSIVEERAAREIYLPAFEAAVKQAHVGAIMGSYNLVNGAHMSQNGPFTGIVRKEWKFEGIIMSDWMATYDGVAAAANGLDLEMPFGRFMNRQTLIPAIQSGALKESVIDDKVRNILRVADRFGWLERPQMDLSLSKYNESNHQVALDAAREGIVLLKNMGILLPLDKQRIKSVLVVGPAAYPGVPVAGGSGQAIPFSSIGPLEGISKLLGPDRTVFYEPGIPSVAQAAQTTDFVTALQNGKPGLTVETFDNAELIGTARTTTVGHINTAGQTFDEIPPEMIEAFMSGQTGQGSSHRWTGYYAAPEAGTYEIAIRGSGERSGYRVYVDNKLVIDGWQYATAMEAAAPLQLSAGSHKVVAEHYQTSPIGGRIQLAIVNRAKLVSSASKAIARTADVVVIAAGFNSENESEGADRTFALPFGQDVLIRELAAVNKKTIVVLTAGGNVDSAPWLDQVSAYLTMWYPGELGGQALAEVLFGVVNPSGRLPVTFERRWEDNPSFASYYPATGTRRVEYKDGIFVGYRGYEHNKVKPLFPFGYGLSYTTFRYGKLSVEPEGGASELKFSVSFDVTNTGARAGADVAQVYVADDHAALLRPPKELKGFSKVMLNPGETRRVTVRLDARSFAYFDPKANGWRIAPGSFGILVGRSSEEIVLKGSAMVAQSAAETFAKNQ
ncbi:MAG: Beta-glucosidase, partial [Acidobacteria bacterium]|nr:Beta-glucosidase [Acidobacteriota bacterium]